MTTSSTDTFNPDIIDLIEDAYEMVGIEVRGGYDMRTARRSLDMLMREWGNRGLNLWTVFRGALSVPAEQRNIILPNYILDVLDASWRTNSGQSIQQDQILQRVSISQWINLSNKYQAGTPSQFFVTRMELDSSLTAAQMKTQLIIWPVPPEAGRIAYWGLRSIQDAGDYTNTMQVPPRFLPALVSGLAYHLAIKSPNAAERIPMLQTEYERQWELAAEEDRDRASFFMVPDMSSYNR